MALNFANITKAISQLNISGVKIRDIHEINAEVQERDCPILIPDPRYFLGDIVLVRDSAGAPSQARKTFQYSLTYDFCFMPIGAERVLEKYGEGVKKLGVILDAIIANDNIGNDTAYDEIVDIEPLRITPYGKTADATGHEFAGCEITILVTEFIN